MCNLYWSNYPNNGNFGITNNKLFPKNGNLSQTNDDLKPQNGSYRSAIGCGGIYWFGANTLLSEPFVASVLFRNIQIPFVIFEERIFGVSQAVVAFQNSLNAANQYFSFNHNGDSVVVIA